MAIELRYEVDLNRRNHFGALMAYPEWVKSLLESAEKMGCWHTGIASDKKQRGTAINADVYGWDETRLAVVQIRESVFHPKRFARVRKDYYLCGWLEDGRVFAHPVDSPARSRRAMMSAQSVVSWTLARIWGCDEDDLKFIERQGDVAFVPARLPDDAQPVPDGEAVIIRNSHRLTGPIYRTPAGTLYARRGAALVHTKGEHARVKAKSGFYRVVAGYRAQVWGFSEPTAD